MDISLLIGWSAALILAFRSVPQVLKCIRQGNARGISKPFLWLWLIGSLMMIVYIVVSVNHDYVLLFAYTFSSVAACIIIRYKHWPTKRY